MPDLISMTDVVSAAMPAGYDKHRMSAFRAGFFAASFGEAGDEDSPGTECCAEARRAGHAAYHAWRQATPAPAILFGHDGTTGGNDDPNG